MFCSIFQACSARRQEWRFSERSLGTRWVSGTSCVSIARFSLPRWGGVWTIASVCEFYCYKVEVLCLEVGAFVGEGLHLAWGRSRLAYQFTILMVELVKLLGLLGSGSIQLPAHTLELPSNLLQLIPNSYIFLHEILVLAALFHKFHFTLLVLATKRLNIA